MPEGEVVGFIATPGQLNIQPRLDGAKAAIKESGKALAELAKEGGDEIKAAVEKQPAKVIDKSKAQMHKANAHEHAHRAKAAAKSTFN